MNDVQEVWKIIPFEPDYQISTFGRIMSCKYKNTKLLTPSKKETGYLEIGLSYKTNKRKWFLVHRLVLSVFNPIPNMDKMEVNHKDENKSNNRLENLEWVTSFENCNYGTRNDRLKEKQGMRVMCVETGVVYSSEKEASMLTGTCHSSISNVLNGKRKKAGGCHWIEV